MRYLRVLLLLAKLGNSEGTVVIYSFFEYDKECVDTQRLLGSSGASLLPTAVQNYSLKNGTFLALLIASAYEINIKRAYLSTFYSPIAGPIQ